MGLDTALNQYIQIKMRNIPDGMVGAVTGIYSPNDWLIAKLVDLDNLGIWLENTNYKRVIVRDKDGNIIPENQQHEDSVTTSLLIRWEYIDSIIRFPNEEIRSCELEGNRIGFRV